MSLTRFLWPQRPRDPSFQCKVALTWLDPSFCQSSPPFSFCFVDPFRERSTLLEALTLSSAFTLTLQSSLPVSCAALHQTLCALRCFPPRSLASPMRSLRPSCILFVPTGRSLALLYFLKAIRAFHFLAAVPRFPSPPFSIIEIFLPCSILTKVL